MKIKDIVAEEKTRLDPKCWTGYKKQGTKIKGGVRVNNCVPEGFNKFAQSNSGVAEGFKNTYSIGDRVDGPLGTGTIIAVSKNINVDGRVKVKLDDPSYAGEDGKYKDSFVLLTTHLKHINEQDVVEETYDGDKFFEAYGELWYNEDGQLDEAEYQGRSVQLGKPMRGDVKKFKVYVKDPSTDSVKKVNFGDPDMRIRKSNPAARRSFRARHNCDNPGPRTKARYWSCCKW